MSEVTQFLEAMDRGESQAAEELLPLMYEAVRLWPQKSALLDLIYRSRFDRLWAQWRGTS